MKVIAEIELYKEGGRSTPFRSGYRPAFRTKDSPDSHYTSGQIILLDRQLMEVGATAIAEITFLKKEILGTSFGVGSLCEFNEGFIKIGKAKVLEIIQH